MFPAGLLWGPLVSGTPPFPLLLPVRLGDLRGRFLAKGRAGRGYRALARNGRILLAGDRPLGELPDRVVWLRVQTWHRAILPGDRPEPYGILLCVGRSVPPAPAYDARLVRCPSPTAVLTVDVGGGWVLEFIPVENR